MPERMSNTSLAVGRRRTWCLSWSNRPIAPNAPRITPRCFCATVSSSGAHQSTTQSPTWLWRSWFSWHRTTQSATSVVHQQSGRLYRCGLSDMRHDAPDSATGGYYRRRSRSEYGGMAPRGRRHRQTIGSTQPTHTDPSGIVRVSGNGRISTSRHASYYAWRRAFRNCWRRTRGSPLSASFAIIVASFSHDGERRAWTTLNN
jgi:hypothetical protein